MNIDNQNIDLEIRINFPNTQYTFNFETVKFSFIFYFFKRWKLLKVN